MLPPWHSIHRVHCVDSSKKCFDRSNRKPKISCCPSTNVPKRREEKTQRYPIKRLFQQPPTHRVRGTHLPADTLHLRFIFLRSTSGVPIMYPPQQLPRTFCLHPLHIFPSSPSSRASSSSTGIFPAAATRAPTPCPDSSSYPYRTTLFHHQMVPPHVAELILPPPQDQPVPSSCGVYNRTSPYIPLSPSPRAPTGMTLFAWSAISAAPALTGHSNAGIAKQTQPQAPPTKAQECQYEVGDYT